MRGFPFTVLAVCLAAGFAAVPAAAQRGGAGAGAPPSAQAAAALDLAGYWVSVVTEDWKYRMVTPAKDAYAPPTLNAEGRRVGSTWDPAWDEATGEACRAYGAGNIMRMPGRLRISWADGSTLRVETDAGTQTRLFHFDRPAAPAAPSWQGHSLASWQYAPGARGAARRGSLKVVTTALRPGYVRRNGLPYSDRTTVTEYWDVNQLPNGDRWLTVTTKVDDPVYFSRPYITSSDFKKLADGAGWAPSLCASR